MPSFPSESEEYTDTREDRGQLPALAELTRARKHLSRLEELLAALTSTLEPLMVPERPRPVDGGQRDAEPPLAEATARAAELSGVTLRLIRVVEELHARLRA